MNNGFFWLGVAGLLMTLNALRPIPGTILAVPSFFGGWLTSELAPQLLVVHVIVVSALSANGAIEGWQGVGGLAAAVFTAFGLVLLILEAQKARDVTEAALRETFGDGYHGEPEPSDLRSPWRQLILPFWMRDRDVKRVRNVVYTDGGRRARLDVYRHRSAPTGCPVVLQIHGGGWTIGNKDQQGKPLMLHFAKRGWVCFAINYPLSPKATWPEQIVACKKALAFIREHGAEYGADPSFVLVTGGSAGGHLTALTALSENDPAFQPGFEAADTSVQAAIPYYGVYDMTGGTNRMARERRKFLERLVFKRRFASEPQLFEAASPICRVDPGHPPFFVIHGEHDSLVPVGEAREFVERLRECKGGPVAYAELPGAQHAFDVFPSIRTAHVIRAAERFANEIRARHANRRDEPSVADADA
jgi:acetyl esterase/lipase